MPNFKWRTTATDGTFQPGQTNLFEFDTNNLTPQEKQVSEILCPNVTQLSKYAVVNTDNNSSNVTTPYFLSSNGTWVQQTTNSNFYVENTKDCWVVIVPDTNYVLRVYLCKDAAEKAQIPDYANTPAIEYRIASGITFDNFDSWRKWTDARPGNSSGGVLICPIRSYISTHHAMSWVYIYKPIGGSALQFSSIYFEYDKATSDVDQGSLPVVSPFLKKGNVVVYDLDERVTILESRVSDLEAAVKSNTDAIKALQTKIVDIGAAGSLYFVSR